MRKNVGTLTLSVIAVATLLNAAPEPAVDVVELVAKADVIVVGRVTEIGDTGLPPVDATGYVFFADVEVANVLKGPPTLSSLRFHFPTAEAGTYHRGIAVGSVRMFFLTSSGDTYEAVSRYYPSLPALPGLASGSTPLDRVLAALARPLRTAGAPSSLKHEVIRTLVFAPSAASVPHLRPALQDSDESVRLAAMAALLNADDATVLPMAEALLLTTPASIPARALQNIRFGIENGLSSPAAVPALRRLLLAGDPATRRAVSAALGRTGSRAAIDALIRGLDDEDPEVRINSVRGLAKVTGQQNRIPSWDAFNEDEATHINFWKGWAREQGVGRPQ